MCGTSDPLGARIPHQFNTLVQVPVLPEEVQHIDPAFGSQEQPYEALLLRGMQPAIFILLCRSEAYGISQGRNQWQGAPQVPVRCVWGILRTQVCSQGPPQDPWS
jgi:hypothetical protein